MNRLQSSTSPYLQQHAHNPVDWFPWCDEAFDIAQKENKPVLVSIGYAACHWCHVMERESFEDKDVAAYMNEHFINIKVDREERPDVDHLYMDALQVMNGQGGWPLNIFVTPHRKPFYGGTYFPPRRIYQRASWMEVLEAIKTTWHMKPQDVAAQSEQIVQHLQQINLQERVSTSLPHTKKEFESIAHALLHQADKEWGGFGTAPKFPQTMSLRFLLQYYRFTKDEATLQQVKLSVDSMISGGIHDQLGGGFSRYSTDTYWLVPHFEKMLYDNALLLETIAELWLITPEEKYKKVVKQTIDFCIRELSANGYGIGFYAALDADSEGEEGKYYVWEYHEIMSILGKPSLELLNFWNIHPEGNWEGKIILNTSQLYPDALEEVFAGKSELCSELEAAREKLLSVRSERIRPLTDTKILLGWNALMIKALLVCGQTFEMQEWTDLAKKNLDFINEHFHENGQWYRIKDSSGTTVAATLEDLSYLIHTTLAMGQLTQDYSYISKASTMWDYVNTYFSDEDGAFFYFSDRRQKDVVVRKIETYDGALPSVNAVMALNAIQLSRWMDNPRLLSRAAIMQQSMVQKIARYPSSFGQWAYVLIYHLKCQTLVGDELEGSYLRLKEYIHYPLILGRPSERYPEVPLTYLNEEQRKLGWHYCTASECLLPSVNIDSIIFKIKMENLLD
jgi:uncharacterized protein YyaL (SSP411 family)